MRYFHDRRTGGIRSVAEVLAMIERGEVARYEIPRRFRALPPMSCRLLEEAARVDGMAERGRDRPER